MQFKINFAFPQTQVQGPNVSVTFVAGYASVPTPIVQAMLLLIGHWYQNRETANANPVTSLPLAFEALITPYRRVGL